MAIHLRRRKYEFTKLTEVRELLYRMWQPTGLDTAFDAYNRARIRELDVKLVMRGK